MLSIIIEYVQRTSHRVNIKIVRGDMGTNILNSNNYTQLLLLP